MTWILVALITALPLGREASRQSTVNLPDWKSAEACEAAGRRLADIYTGPYFTFEWRCVEAITPAAGVEVG